MGGAEVSGSGDMQKEIDFVRRLERDFPEVKFVYGAVRFSCRLEKGDFTVHLGPYCENYALLALHELGHALCKHKDYITDVSRLKMEAEAWERAKTVLLQYKKSVLAPGADKYRRGDIEGQDYVPEWDEELVQDKLDTYRDWLHNKSRCKKCGLTRYQTEDGEYHCPRCENFT